MQNLQFHSSLACVIKLLQVWYLREALSKGHRWINLVQEEYKIRYKNLSLYIVHLGSYSQNFIFFAAYKWAQLAGVSSPASLSCY